MKFFRYLILAVFASGEEEDDHAKDFKDFDPNGDGFSDPQELRVKFKNLSERELHEFWNTIDKSQRGYFNMNEYIEFARGRTEQ